MSIKSILCIVGGTPDEMHVINTALMIGKANGAHIRFLHVSQTATAYASAYGEGIIATAAIVDAIEKENRKRLENAKNHVGTLAVRHHVSLDMPESPVHHASAKFVHLNGFAAREVAREGRLSDIIIIGRGRAVPNALDDSTVVAALFDTGRPVMLLPAQETGIPGEYKTIAVAWKGTKEASQAIFNAMPFLEKAEKVCVLTAEGKGETYDLAAEAALMDYLCLHGAHAQGVVVASGARTPAEALLARAKELKADLLVMGAYGHGRLREMLLGGVTHHMLEKADMPLLLSH